MSEPATCRAHGTPTALTCVECGVPICPACAVSTAIGFKCEEHAVRRHPRSGAGRKLWLDEHPRRGAIIAALVALVAGVVLGVLVRPSATPPSGSTSAGGTSGTSSPTRIGPTPSLTDGIATFLLGPSPPPGFEGDLDVVAVRGTGDADSRPFRITTTGVTGVMSGQATASFYILPVGASPDPSQPRTTGCDGGCSGGWSAPRLTPGQYHLVVRAPAGTSWSITIEEVVRLPLVVRTSTPAPVQVSGGEEPVISARGVGNQKTGVFHVFGGHLSGVLSQSGTSSYFFLVPAGTPFDRGSKPITSCEAGCGSRGWSASVTPGDYYLVVVADGGWSFDATVVSP